jgi:DNA polymerase III alpha subunit
MDFTLIKNGKKKAIFDYKLQEVTKNTYGLYIYQEQIMQSVVALGGFSLVEADQVRTIIKKFDKVGMLKVEQQFIDGAINKGCDEVVAKQIWDKLVAFSGYGFNKSHAFAYSVMTYQSQWMKANYPLEFWTTSLQFADEKDIPKRISELRKLDQGISIKPPSINYSDILFECQKDTLSIYWSLSKIKSVGDVAVKNIIEERNKNGLFGSYDDFVSRVPKNKVNKRVITHLILAGALDEVEDIRRNTERLALLIYHFSKYKEQLPEDFQDEELLSKTYFWTLKQRDLTGFGNIDYKSYLRNLKSKEAKKLSEIYINSEKFFELKDYSRVSICGKIIHKTERKSKHGEFLVVGVVCNDDFLLVNVWNDYYAPNSEFFADCVGKMICISGKSKFDTWKHQNILNTTDETILIEL